MEIVDLPAFGPDDYAAVVDGEVDPFGTDRLAIQWRRKTDHVGLRHEGRLIGCAGWVPIEGQVAGAAVEGVGLGGVLVHRSYRGSGIGATLVSGAMDGMRKTGRALGLLFCRPERLRFYRELGWEEIDHIVTADQADGPPVVVPLRSCWTALGPGASAPPDLRIDGLPF